MRDGRWFAVVIMLVMLVVTGCGRDQTTAPVSWDGPDSQVVFSSDNAHCGKTTAAKRRGLPGYIVVNKGEIAGIYHSTDRVVTVTPEMVETGFRKGGLVLMRPQDLKREVYVGGSSGGKPPVEVLVYELGGCD